MGGLLIDTLTYDFFEENDLFIGDSEKLFRDTDKFI